MQTKKQYMMNALLLTAVAFLMRTVSVGFNIYISGLVGAETMGLLSLISGVYGFATTLATSGIHLATVRIISERLQKTGGSECKRCLTACLCYAAFFGTLATILLAVLARPIGLFVLKDPRTVHALLLLSATLLPIALSSVLNGYFTAVRRAFKNAISQVTEQFVKIALTTYLLIVIAPKTVEGSVIAVLMGGAVAESASLCLNLLLYLLDKRHFKNVSQRKYGTPLRVVSVAMPVAISAYIRSGLLTLEHVLIPIGLKSYGINYAAALSSYGALHSMALPVVLYPAALLSSFAALLIPEITEQESAGNRREIRYIAGRVYQMTLLFAVGASAIMLFLSGELGQVLYENKEVSYFIKWLAPLVPIMYMDTATDAMLKGLGQQVYSMNVNIIDALVSVLSVWILVPRMGIMGYLVTIYITEILNATCSICRLLKISGYIPNPTKLLLRPMISAIGATCISHLILAVCKQDGVPSPLSLTMHILLVCVFYMALLTTTNAFGKAEWQWLRSLFLNQEGVSRKSCIHRLFFKKKPQTTSKQ